jgi:hypothetical protein
MPEPERARERERERREESPERERRREKTRLKWVPPGVPVNRAKWASGDEGRKEGRKEGRLVGRYLGTHQPTNSNPFDGDIAANLGAAIWLGTPANSLI